MSSEIATMSLHDTSNVIAIPRPAKLDTLQPGIIYHIAQHLRVATPLQVPSCRCSKPIRKLSPPQAGEGYKISPTDPAFNLSRVCTSLKGVLETEVKGEFRTTYCSVGIEGCARVSGVLRENVRYVLRYLSFSLTWRMDTTDRSLTDHSRSPPDPNTP